MNENATTQTKATNIIDSVLRGDHDNEIKAFYATHSELAEQRKSMTREQKINRILDLFEKLGAMEETPEQKAEREEFAKLDKLLSQQCTSPELDSFYNTYIKRKQAAKYDECLLIMDIFNYGVICGKRAERAHRKGEQV